MKYLQLFEGFLKHYGEKMTLADFKSLKPGQRVKYLGGSFEVVEPGDVLVLIDDEGNKLRVNYNMFNQKGAINQP
jgi:hypothetical protein